MQRHQQGIDSVPFIGYIDTLAAIVLVFLVITAFTAIAFTLSKQAMLNAQHETEQLRTELDGLQDAQRQIQELQAKIEQYEERLQAAGYENIQEIPHRIEWRDAALTKQVLQNTGWAGKVVDLPMYEDWQQMTLFNIEELKKLSESGEHLVDIQRKLERYDNVLANTGYTDIAEIPPKEDWETSQSRLLSYQKLLEETGFQGDIDTLYNFFEQWNQIILEMKRIFKVQVNEPEQVLYKLQKLESLQKKVVIPVAQGSIFFSFGDVTIEDEFKQVLDKHIKEARKAITNGTYDLIQIEGHTDAIPIRSDNPLYHDNWELSAARAHAVAKYFIQRGIPPEHLAVVGHGEYKPKVSGDTREKMAQNRRIEIVFLNTSLLNLGMEEE